jgi:aminoglycoside phosphotransferase (APT) family kinase protein
MPTSRPQAGVDERHIRQTLMPALAAVCGEVGFDHRDATLLRYVVNAVFRLSRQPVVVRIVLAPALRHRVPKVVDVARWLAAHDVPAVRLVEGIEQPVSVGAHLATFWHEVPPVGAQPTGADLARLLRRLHALPDPCFELPGWNPLATVRMRLADADGLDEEDRDFLERRCAVVQAALAGLTYALPPGLIHGDAWLGNLIPGPDGPVLCDFDSTCTGPREWDLVPMGIGQVRLGHPPQQYRDFTTCYGFDVMGWSGFEVLRQVRELNMVAGALPVLRDNPLARAEFTRRVRALRGGEPDTRWEPYQ